MLHVLLVFLFSIELMMIFCKAHLVVCLSRGDNKIGKTFCGQNNDHTTKPKLELPINNICTSLKFYCIPGRWNLIVCNHT